MNATIIIIEGKRSDVPTFASDLMKKGHSVDLVTTGNAALERLKNKLPDMVIVNAASMRTTGVRICQSIRRQANQVPIVLILEQKPAKTDKFDADVVLALPFTILKLNNRIQPFTPKTSDSLVNVGVFELDAEHRLLRFNDQQIHLTPRLTSLMKILMENAGTVIPREELFRNVWETAYTDDMRTLEVHISWLRRAIEENPRAPVYIKTTRGVGYWLDIGD
jgi:DNA-binding response OmpR family regulator